MNCQTCGGPMRPLFTGWFCPRDCDRDKPPTAQQQRGPLWVGVMRDGHTYEVHTVWTLEQLETFLPWRDTDRRWHTVMLYADEAEDWAENLRGVCNSTSPGVHSNEESMRFVVGLTVDRDREIAASGIGSRKVTYLIRRRDP